VGCWHAVKPALCSSLSEPRVINAFKSDLLQHGSHMHQRLQFRLKRDRQSPNCLAFYLTSAVHVPVTCSWTSKKVFGRKIARFRPKTQMADSIQNWCFRRWKRISSKRSGLLLVPSEVSPYTIAKFRFIYSWRWLHCLTLLVERQEGNPVCKKPRLFSSDDVLLCEIRPRFDIIWATPEKKAC